MDTLRMIEPDLLVVITWIIGLVGVVCTTIGLIGLLRRRWNVEGTMAWMFPAILSFTMDRFGWTPLVVTLIVLAGCWAWTLRANLLEEGAAA